MYNPQHQQQQFHHPSQYGQFSQPQHQFSQPQTNVNVNAAATQFNLGAQAFVPQNAAPQQQQQQAQQAMMQQQYMYNPNNLANETNILKEKLQRRLAKDIEDFQAELANFPNFNAMPLKDKLEEWHFNVWPTKGVYADYCINGIIQFPTEYPQKPPTIETSVPIPHPNVKTISSKHWVHLDLLSASRWKQTYSILDIFRELSKVFDATNMSDLAVDSKEIIAAQQKLNTFKCMWTGHTSQNPVPAKGQPILHRRREIDQLHASQPLTIENHDYQWRYCRIKHIECSFGKVYYEARVVSSVLGPNNLTTIQVGWALPPDDDPALGEEFEYVVLGNRYYMQRIAGVIIHKRPYAISHDNEISTGFGGQNDKIACAADFEAKTIAFWINGNMVGVINFPNSFIESEKPLVPVIGLSFSSVVLNFKNLHMPIAELSNSYLTIQEYLQIDRSDWVWERGSLVDWNVLFTYGLPMDIGNDNDSNQRRNNEVTKDSDKYRQIVLEIFHCLDYLDLRKCREVCKIWNEVINRAYFVHRSQLKCYYSDKSFDNASTCIGLMFNLKLESLKNESHNQNNKKKNNRKNKDIFDMKLDILSYSKDCISFSVWDKLNIHIDSKHEEFTHFLPIIINEQHGLRVTKILTIQIAKIIERQGFRAEYALFILSSLLSSVIKSLHRELFIKKKNKQNNKQQIISEHVTIWCHLHHILLQLCTKFQSLQTAADSKIRELFENTTPTKSNQRNKSKQQLSAIPDLGILIMYLLISEFTWHTIRRLWVEESFSRDCKKLCGNGKNEHIKNELDNPKLPDDARLKIMYKYTSESRSLTRLLLAFITLQPEYNEQRNGKDASKMSIEEQLRLYNLRFGSPNQHWIGEIEDKVEQIEASRGWDEYFKGIYVVAPPQPVLCQLLFRCFIQGAEQGYYEIHSKLPTNMSRKTSSNQPSNSNMNGPPSQSNAQQPQIYQNGRDNMRNNQSSQSQRGGNNNNRRNGNQRNNMQNNDNYGMNSNRGGRVNQVKSSRFVFDDDDSDRRRNNNRDMDRRGGNNMMNNNYGNGFNNMRGNGRNMGQRGRGRGGGSMYDRNDRNYGQSGRGGRGGRGGNRGGRGGRGGRGRGGGDNFYDPNFEPSKNVSQYTAFKHSAKAISAFKGLPEWIRKGGQGGKDGNGPQINKFNKLQAKIMGDLCLGNDCILVGNAGVGKTTAIVLSAFYRLYTKKAPAHCLFIAMDQIHALNLQKFCLQLGEHVPDLRVIDQVRGSRIVNQRMLEEGRNIFICIPQKAVDLCQRGRESLTENLVSVSIFDGDALLVVPGFNKLKQIFKWIPQNINTNIISTSVCQEMRQNMGQLINFSSSKTKKYFEQKTDNMKYWFIFCPKRSLRLAMFTELCKVNPHRQGIIFVCQFRDAQILQSSMKGNKDDVVFNSKILNDEKIADANAIINSYNNGTTQYIICHERSPIHILQNINSLKLKVIINYDLRTSSAYLQRCSISKYTGANNKVHVISLIDEQQTGVYEKVEENCSVELQELPHNVAEVLCDPEDGGNDDDDESD